MFIDSPENIDYVAEHGAYRTFQADNIAVKAVEGKQKELEEEEANDYYNELQTYSFKSFQKTCIKFYAVLL